jgi:predicted ArsR family transcriptional regulator
MSVVKTSTDTRTRDAVVHHLLSAGPSTAACLAAEFGLSAAGVRRHLDALLAEGLVTSRQAGVVGRRSRGRPARTYLLTDAGRQRLSHSYDLLATEALGYLAEHLGPAAVADFARRRAQASLAPFQDEIAAAPTVAAKASVVADALTAAGFAATAEPVRAGEQLCQHHCPVAHVATKYPQLCEEELAVMTAALGTYAQRLATIARGDSFCTTFIPAASPSVAGAHAPVGRGPDPGGDPQHTPAPGHHLSTASASGRTTR